MKTIQNHDISCFFDETTGKLLRVTRRQLSLDFDGFFFDLGCNEQMLNSLFGYESMQEFRTWNLPAINPTGTLFDLIPVNTDFHEESADVTYQKGALAITVHYLVCSNNLKISLSLKNISGEVLYLNACILALKLKRLQDVTFDFPGNAPICYCEADKLEINQAVQTGLVNFAVHSRFADGDLNLLFIDPTEKWGCGVYRDETTTNYAYNAALEMDLRPGQECQVGSLYVLPCCPASAADTAVKQSNTSPEAASFAGDGNPYLQIRQLVEALGYYPAQGGITDGVMYSCHPAGTMDSDFPLKEDLFQYADYLDSLKKMGIDHVWLLPVFDHNEQGVYHSNDQSVIAERYGGEAGCKFYCDKAHELGMTILFDYVPHGPVPDYPLVAEHPDWPSKRRDGSLQDEWECVSMDYNHPGYQEYTAELVHDHVNRFGVDGARIDCAMGGLSNWRPYENNRPSGNSVLAGVHITESIREGFLRGKKRSFILPENFNLIPNYYHCTDLFYGMNLYRAFVDLEQYLAPEPARYADLLTDFLEREAWITPEHYHKLRFLGNHDTVSWVWQSKRAVDCYGVGGAKALFAVISFIDGVPMIYQGDEDPSIYGGSSENLTDFFTRLFHDRHEYLPAGGNTTQYLHTGTPVMAFIRTEGSEETNEFSSTGLGSILVAVNLSDTAQSIDLTAYPGAALISSGLSDDKSGTLSAYSYHIYQLA